jgi:hypothetical protein
MDMWKILRQMTPTTSQFTNVPLMIQEVVCFANNNSQNSQHGGR